MPQKYSYHLIYLIAKNYQLLPEPLDPAYSRLKRELFGAQPLPNQQQEEGGNGLLDFCAGSGERALCGFSP